MSDLQVGDKVNVVGNSIGLHSDLTKLGVQGYVVEILENGNPVVEYSFKFMINRSEFNDEDLQIYG